jgi:hypothetical protein
MTQQALLAPHKKWRDHLVFQLRMEDVPGDRIGDILLEVDSHVAETGESPEDAFGDPRAYARTRASALPRTGKSDDEGMGALPIAIISFFGSMLFVSGAMGLGKGSESLYFLPPWLVLILGATLLGYAIMNLPEDFVRHPVTNKPLLGDGPQSKKVLGTIIGLAGIVFLFIGRLLA